MFVNAKIAILAACATAALLASQTDAKPSYSAKIPNGEAMGMSLGHAGEDYTAFGTMFSKAGLSWSAVCKQTWPGASINVGAALGDPCCKWTEGATPEKVLKAPNPTADACAASAPAATPAAATATQAPAGKTSTAPATTPAPPANATPKVTPASTKANGGGKAPLAPTIPGGQLCE